MNTDTKISSSDIVEAFSYLIDYGFVIGGQTDTPTRVSSSYLGNKFNIALSFEYRECNFDFVVIDKYNPADYRPIWKLLQAFERDFLVSQITPRDSSDRPALNRFAALFKKHFAHLRDEQFLMK